MWGGGGGPQSGGKLSDTLRLDYANYLLVRARQADSLRLQNKSARLVFSCGRDRPLRESLDQLQWLPIRERIRNNIHLITFKCINSIELRSFTDVTRLAIHRCSSRVGAQALSTAAPRMWNELPVHIREATI